MPSLEGFLNVVIPLGIFVFLAAAMWYKLKTPMSGFINWLKELFGWTKDKVANSNATGYAEEIVYR